MRLRALLSPEPAGEAARRFLDGGEPADREPYARLDQPGVQATHDPDGGRLTLRFPREAAPAPEALFAALSAVATDARVGVVLLAPWPDRSVHASRKVAADL